MVFTSVHDHIPSGAYCMHGKLLYTIVLMKHKTKKRIRLVGILLALFLGAMLLMVVPFGDTENHVEVDPEAQDEEVTLTYPTLEPDVEIGTDGFVAAVEMIGEGLESTTLITLQTEVNSVYFIALPANHRTVCEAGDALADASVITQGDKIAVRGKTDADGRIVPCESEHHSLRIRGVYKNPDVGLTFTYKKSPAGYVLMTDGYDFSTSSLFVTGALLLPQSGVDSERPPVTIVRVYNNPDGLEALEWAQENQSETLIHRALAEPAEISVGRKDAIGYTVQGPFFMDIYVTAFGEFVLLINGEYAEYDSEPFQDIGELVRTISFTM